MQSFEGILNFSSYRVDAMTKTFPINCNLRWQELLSPEEIRNWVNSQQVPKRLY